MSQPAHRDGEARFRFSPRTNRAHEIHWQQWEDETFERAAPENKPILLSISAVCCHWCHVMDETSYSSDGVIDAIHSDFVPVRVDADERPDIDRRYNQGGWPSTVLLTPTGEVLVGATYVPPPQMSALLSEVREFYRSNQADIQASDWSVPHFEKMLEDNAGLLDTYQAYKLFSAVYGRAVDRLLHEPVTITVVVGTREANGGDLLYSSLHAYAPWKVVRVVSPTRDAALVREAGYGPEPESRAYVCHDHTCSAAFSQGDDVEKAVRTC